MDERSTEDEKLKAMEGFKVMAQACRTCIYRSDSPLDLKELEDKARDRYGGFRSYRVCHHHHTACCRGFWNRHKEEFTAGQLAQRLGLVVEVREETRWPNPPRRCGNIETTPKPGESRRDAAKPGRRESSSLADRKTLSPSPRSGGQ